MHSGRVLCRDDTLAESQLRDGDLLTLVVKPASSFVLLFNAGGFVPLWDIDDCNMIRTFRGRLCREVNAVALSQNGILALSGSHDGTAWLWDTDSGGLIQCFDSKLRNEYTSEPVPVTCVGFVVNVEFRNIVVTGNGDGFIMLWNMEDMGKLLHISLLWSLYRSSIWEV